MSNCLEFYCADATHNCFIEKNLTKTKRKNSFCGSTTRYGEHTMHIGSDPAANSAAVTVVAAGSGRRFAFELLPAGATVAWLLSEVLRGEEAAAGAGSTESAAGEGPHSCAPMAMMSERR